MDEEKNDTIFQYILLIAILSLIGWLVYRHTGQEAKQLSPDFWAGAALTILVQLAREKFNLKKPST